MKTLLRIERNAQPHWVGDGFPVRSIFSYQTLGRELSPFLLLDYAGPAKFPPTEDRRGVGEHPHRGFETVTIAYQGDVEHRDSGGSHGKIGPGDVQWMTAASGVVHEEFHGAEFGRRGGVFEMIQLWVNLPAQFKMSRPRYQELKAASIPEVELADDAGRVRVIAGEFKGATGPAKTFTPVNLWDLRLDAGGISEWSVPETHNAALFVLRGEVRLDGAETLGAAELAVFEPSSDPFKIECASETTALLLSGEPIDEPIVGQGPFVMNTQAEIRQAMIDYQAGKLGRLDS